MKGLVLFLTIALSVCGINKVQAEDFSALNAEGKIIYYDILQGTTNVEVVCRGQFYDSYANEYEGAITIPSTVSYNGVNYTVTTIGGWAFDGCSNLSMVTISDSVSLIRNSAFTGCSQLDTVICLAQNATRIGDKLLCQYSCREIPLRSLQSSKPLPISYL